MALLVTGLLFVNAHKSPLDELGCHQENPDSKYHCHTGPLKGREFSSKEEAERLISAVQAVASPDFSVVVETDPAAQKTDRGPASTGNVDLPPPPPAPPKAVINNSLLKVISWRLNKNGENLDYDRIANVFSEADIAIMQDIDLDEVGKGPLHIIGDLVQSRIGEKVCRMWFRTGSKKEKYGILWRNSTIGHVAKAGEIKESCGEMAVVVPLTKKKPIASSLFFSKVQKKMFQLGTINLESRPKKADATIAYVFRSIESSNWPTLVAGDLKLSSRSGAKTIEKMKFKTALTGRAPAGQHGPARLTTDNLWTRNAVVVRAVSINLYDRFSELNRKEIDKRFSGSFPILAEMALMSEPDEHISSMIVSTRAKERAARREASSGGKKVIEAKKTDLFEEDTAEDLEQEAQDVDYDLREPAAKPKKKKKIKKKKR